MVAEPRVKQAQFDFGCGPVDWVRLSSGHVDKGQVGMCQV